LKLFYIVYKACERKSSASKSMQLSSAQGLFATFLTMHLIQLFLIIYNLTGMSIPDLDGVYFIIIWGVYFVATGVILYYFNRKILTKAIARNKDSIGLTSARLITFSYLIANIWLTALMFAFKK
jgi:Kef-type K+ transport system membrane component KefB